MFKFKVGNKGVALFLVLATLFIVTALAVIILNAMLSQGRLTHHQISRIRAYYATQAAMNLAFDRLRRGDASNFSLCNSGCTVFDNDIPYKVDVTIEDPPNAITGLRTITLTTDYTYTP